MVSSPRIVSRLLLWLSFSAVAVAAPVDPWGRPAHLRAVMAPPQTWADLSAPERRVRLWWDETDPAAGAVSVQALLAGRWRTLAGDIAPGWESPPLPVGTPLRLRAAGAWTRWTAPMVADPWASPTDLARIAGPSGALLDGGVGQIDSDGTLAWASTLQGGLVRATAGGGQVEVLTRWHGLPDDRVIAVDVDPERGWVLVGTANGAALLDTTGRTLRVWDRELPDRHVQAVLIDAEDGALWLGTYQGLARVDPAGGAVQTLLEPWSVFSLTDAATPGEVWVGYDGLRRIDREGQTVFPPPSAAEGDLSAQLGALKVYDALLLGPSDEALLLADEARGVLRLSGTAGLSPEVGYPSAEVYGLAPGAWAAGAAAGLVGPAGRRLGRAEGLPSATVWSVAVQGATGLWVGTRWGLAWLGEGAQQAEALALSEWPAELEARAMLLEPDGALLGGPLGLWGVGAAVTRWAPLLAAVRGPVVAIVQLEGEVWVVGESKITRSTPQGALETVDLPGTATAAAVWSDTLWLATPAAVWRYARSGSRFVEGAALAGVQALAASPAAGGALWATDAEGKVHRLVFGTTRAYGQSGPSLAVAPAARSVCLGTTSGLERLDIETGDIEDVLGMQDYSVRITAVATTSDGEGCWLGAEDGTIGRVPFNGPPQMVRLTSAEAPDPTALIPDPTDPDVVWVLTTAGTWRVSLP